MILVMAGEAGAFREALASAAPAVAVDIVSGGVSEAADMLKTLRMQGKRAFARIHALTSGLADSDLDALMPAAPHGIILPQACGGRDVQHLGAKLAVREAENGLEEGATKILASGADLPEAIFALGLMARATRRLVGLLWDAEALAGALGVEPDAPVLAQARAQIVFSAASAGVPAFIAAGDSRELLSQARRDGFRGALLTNVAAAEAAERIFG